MIRYSKSSNAYGDVLWAERGEKFIDAHLIYLSPLTGLCFREARVDSGHDLGELFAGNVVGRVVGTDDVQTH